MERRELGTYGERLATNYLTAQGYKLLDANYRAMRCEIDAVMQDGQTLMFVEVKTRRTQSYGFGREAVTYQKQKNIVKAAECYLHEKQRYDQPVRFDVVEVEPASGRVTHIKNAFGV